MPTARLQHHLALVSALCLPLFLVLPSSPLKAQPPVVAVDASMAAKLEAAPTSKEPLALPGVVIEELPKGSALEKAGLQVGDVVLSWERLPNQPANPEPASGKIDGPFDWMWLEVEQAPRGEVVLRGQRGGESLEFKIEPGVWDPKVRPVWSQALEKIYLAGKAQLVLGAIEDAVGEWRSMGNGLEGEGSRLLQAWLSLRVGEAWGEKGDWGKAAEADRAALDASETPLSQIAALEAMGTVHEMRNEYEMAEKLYLSGLEKWQRIGPESLGIARIFSHLGALAWKRRENMDGAQLYIQRSLEIREKIAPQSLAVASSLDGLGSVAWIRGDADTAYDLTFRALQIRKRLAPGGLEVALSLNNMATVVRDRGNLDHAYDYLLQALGIQQRLAPDSLTVALILNNMGVMAWLQKDMERAQHHLLRALHIREELAPHSLSVASILNNLAAVARLQGNRDLSLSYQQQALEIQNRLAPRSLRVAQSLNNLGSLARQEGELDLAYNYYLKALVIREELTPGGLAVAESLSNLGILALEREQSDQAEGYHQRALKVREQIAPESLVVAESLKNLGDVAKVQAKPDQAQDLYIRALDALEHQILRLGGSYDAQANFRDQHQFYYHDLLGLLLTQSRFVEAFNVLERFRAQVFLVMLAERDTVFTADIPIELDRERRRLGVLYGRTLKNLAEFNPKDNGQEIEATHRELQKLDSEAGDIESQIRQASPRLAALQYPKPFETTDARQALDPGTLLLSYSVGKERTVLFALSRLGDLEVKMIPLGEDALRSQVEQLLGLLREAAQNSSLGAVRQHRFQTTGRELYSALLGPLAGRIAVSERLLILPDGPLHALPFAALVRDVGTESEPSGVQYLAEWKPLHVALSATVFAELKQGRPHGGSTSQNLHQLAAFGDPFYPKSLIKAQGTSTTSLPATGVIAQADVPSTDPIVRSAAERGVFNWEPLPYTRQEVEGIARLFPEGAARTFLGPEALEDRIKSLDPKTRILHLAAHGYTDEHLPSSSFVALTIPEDKKADASGPERDNGLLQVWEIFERVRLDADLVVLSACDTGLGKEQGGEGLIGLTRAFQYAGARTVMASLWSVQDRATSELMIRFYKHLRAGLPKDEALRQAQIELIRGPIEVLNEKGEKTLLDASAPYYWAGFQLYGDWQ